MSDKVLQAFEQTSFAGKHVGDSKLTGLQTQTTVTVNVAARLKDMW
jgi:hypothetical protein